MVEYKLSKVAAHLKKKTNFTYPLINCFLCKACDRHNKRLFS